MLSDLFLVEIQYKGIFRRLFNLVTGSYFDNKETDQISITRKTLIRNKYRLQINKQIREI